MVLLVLKVLVPLLSVVPILRSEWSKQPDMGVWEAARRKAVSIVVAAVCVMVLVVDHRTQSAAVGAAQEEAADAREARRRIEESTAEVVALMRERDPGLTELEALDRLAEELRELHKRSASLEDQLTGLKMYRDVAELNVLGDPGTAGSGLRYSSALTRALKGSWYERDGQLYQRCDQTSLAKFSAVAGSHPTFPFAHSALADCAFEAGDDSWRQHADRALKILRHTTRMSGHHRHHDEVYEHLISRLEQQQ